MCVREHKKENIVCAQRKQQHKIRIKSEAFVYLEFNQNDYYVACLCVVYELADPQNEMSVKCQLVASVSWIYWCGLVKRKKNITPHHANSHQTKPNKTKLRRGKHLHTHTHSESEIDGKTQQSSFFCAMTCNGTHTSDVHAYAQTHVTCTVIRWLTCILLLPWIFNSPLQRILHIFSCSKRKPHALFSDSYANSC